uniref:FTH domain-containing protein n=1 Tax=Caenorhabditis tropicalis TaxID=1561998 RepID=A0A1I7V230_9PELO
MSDALYWEQLPPMFQRSVVKYLGLIDRSSLRKTSKSDKDLVDSVPIHLAELGFVDSGPQIRLFVQEHPKIIDGIVHFSKFHISGEEIIDEFLKLFENPRSFVDFLYFDFEKVTSHQFLTEFYEKLMNQPEKYKLRTKKLYWTNRKPNEYLLDVLGRVDSKILKGVELNCQLMPEYLQKVLETEQCKNARSFSLGSFCVCTLPVTSLMNWDYLDIYVHRFTEEEIWEMIKNFRSTNRPVGARFHFYNFLPVNRIIEIPVLLNLFDVPPVNVYEYDDRDKFHTQLFKLENRNEVLRVEITAQSVIGTILANN